MLQYNKWMFSKDHLNFHFPLFTTSMHMVVQFCLASTVLFFVPKLRPQASVASAHDTAPGDDLTASEKPAMTRWFYLTRCVPCGAATGLDIGLGNMSLRFITLTFYSTLLSQSLDLDFADISKQCASLLRLPSCSPSPSSFDSRSRP